LHGTADSAETGIRLNSLTGAAACPAEERDILPASDDCEELVEALELFRQEGAARTIRDI
jgi:hypothetical protein